MEGERFGHIDTWVDMSQAYRRINYQINRMRWYLVPLVALLAAASYLPIKQLVTHPLSRIENPIRHLFTGNLNQDLTSDGSRDLRLLTESMTQHAAALRREKNHLQEVQTVREEAEAASQAKSCFLSTMGHELKMPIHGILGMAQLIQGEDQNPVQQKRLSLLSQSAEHLSDLVDDILDIADLTVDGLPLRIEVEDSGIGIAGADQAGLFNAFVQAHSGLDREYGGSGIGLAICRQLVRSSGGRIGVESKPGKGSTFWIELTLPMTSQARLTGEAFHPCQHGPAATDARAVGQ